MRYGLPNHSVRKSYVQTEPQVNEKAELAIAAKVEYCSGSYDVRTVGPSGD